jgi:hypothetical protein
MKTVPGVIPGVTRARAVITPSRERTRTRAPSVIASRSASAGWQRLHRLTFWSLLVRNPGHRSCLGVVHTRARVSGAGTLTGASGRRQ